jgi:hypothetical protein
MQSFVDSCHSGKIEYSHGAESSHLSSALAHIGNISWKLGEPASPDSLRKAVKNADMSDALNRMLAHLEANQIDPTKQLLTLGKPLTVDPETETFTGDFAGQANPLLKGSYRKGFDLPL